MAPKIEVAKDTGIFDNLDALRVETPTAPLSSLGPKRRRRLTESFARIPHERGLALHQQGIGSAGWVILIELDRLILHERGRNPVRLTNRNLRRYGIDHKKKWRALLRLREAGVITIEQHGRQAPLITHLWFPIGG